MFIAQPPPHTSLYAADAHTLSYIEVASVQEESFRLEPSDNAAVSAEIVVPEFTGLCKALNINKIALKELLSLKLLSGYALSHL